MERVKLVEELARAICYGSSNCVHYVDGKHTPCSDETGARKPCAASEAQLILSAHWPAAKAVLARLDQLGLVVVPREATPEQIWAAHIDTDVAATEARGIYHAMIEEYRAMISATADAAT